MLKKIRYFIEGILVKVIYWLITRISFETASNIGGAVGRVIGPYLPRSKVAQKNLKCSMPELDDKQIDQIIVDMWENLGRVFTEFPHMAKLDKESLNKVLTVEGLEHLEKIRNINKGSIIVTGHLANWEIGSKALAVYDFLANGVYRKGNNPVLDRIIQQIRNHYQTNAIPKGKAGARLLVQSIKQGGRVGVLIDQKMDDGIPVKFFGRDAMTATAIAKLALKFDCPLVPVRVVRVQAHYQKLIIYPPLEITKTGDREADTKNIMATINSILEEWIREYPSQWIWIHNRWPKDS